MAETANGTPPGTIGWSGGYGTRWQSDLASGLTTILLTQRMFDGPKPAAVYDTFEADARNPGQARL